MRTGGRVVPVAQRRHTRGAGLKGRRQWHVRVGCTLGDTVRQAARYFGCRAEWRDGRNTRPLVVRPDVYVLEHRNVLLQHHVVERHDGERGHADRNTHVVDVHCRAWNVTELLPGLGHDQLIFRPRDKRLSEGERPTHRGVDDGRSASTNWNVVLVRPNEIAGSIGVEISSEAWIGARLQNRYKRVTRDQVLPGREELRPDIA